MVVSRRGAEVSHEGAMGTVVSHEYVVRITVAIDPYSSDDPQLVLDMTKALLLEETTNGHTQNLKPHP